MKTCKRCSQNKPPSEFRSGKRYRDGLHPWCKPCMREYGAGWYKKNKVQHNARAVAWREANPKKTRQIDRRWKEKNKEKTSERYRAYRREHLAEDAARVSQRRAAKLRATPKWASNDKINAIYRQARDCSERYGEPYHVDHMVPLNSQYVCGLHCEQNLQAIPARRNLSMSNLIWPDMWMKSDVVPKRIEQAQKQQRLFA